MGAAERAADLSFHSSFSLGSYYGMLLALAPPDMLR